jgi:hypothetical protein
MGSTRPTVRGITGARLPPQDFRVLDADVAQITELSAPPLIFRLAGD